MNYRWRAGALLVLVAVVTVVSSSVFGFMHKDEPIVSGPGVTDIKMLSDYHPGLKGTAADTEVYIMEGDKEGDTFLLLGGVHPNEPAGFVTAVVVIEKAIVEEGRVIVIPRSNRSAFTHSEPEEAYPQKFRIDLPDGSERYFRFGSRDTNPLHQWPDPDIFVHYPSGQLLSGQETRNLNRSFPGKKDGNLTQQVAYAITTLIKEEKATVTLDLHEASPEYPVINTMVAHEDAVELGSAMRFLLDGNFDIGMEISPDRLRGLSHRELGDYTETLAILAETANPAQGRLRGRTNEDLVLTGYDKSNHRAAEMGRLFVEFTEDGHPIEQRVARHLRTVEALTEAYTMFGHGEKQISFAEFPDFREVEEKGLGYFLTPIEKDN